MLRMNMSNVSTSNGYQLSEADVELVVKANPKQTAFAWKQLSIRTKGTVQAVINEHTNNPSVITCVDDISLEFENINISSFKFKEDGVPYYIAYGY